MTSTGYRFFIVTKRLERPKHIRPGCICYIREHRYKSESSKPGAAITKLPVIPMFSQTSLDYKIDLSCMEELSGEEAELLMALPDDTDRLKWFRDKDALHTYLGLSEGTAVTVDEDGKKMRGIIRYIGPLTGTTGSYDPIKGKFFGIELQGADRGKGDTDGTYKYEKYFRCEKKCGIFAPFSKISPVVPSSLSPPISEPSPQAQTEKLSPGDRVTYFIHEKCRHGMVVDVLEEDGVLLVRISTDTDETGKLGGEVKVPLDLVAKGEVPSGPESMDVDPPPPKGLADELSMGLHSMVEVTLGKGNSYGIIRWIGHVPDREETTVGLELEDDSGVSDGSFKGQRFFFCPPRRALFVKISSCRPDSRFHGRSNHNERLPGLDNTDKDAGCSTETLETVPPVSTEDVKQLLIGQMKGIQGHCNSCYMDATLFGLFSCSSVLDSMLFKSTTPQDSPIQKTLLRDIVNPLRRWGFVEGRHIMNLRQQLQKHGYSHSFTTDEKDPEEFLIVIMHHILVLEPLLKLSAAGKVQESYCYQIFLDQNHSLVLPTVQQLLEHSFHTAGLKLAEVPSCLILQMPRFGKKFKMFDKIFPSLELDITDLLSEGPQQCMLCGNLATDECTDCFKDPVFSSTGFKVFCKTCSAQVHTHPQRRSHQPVPLDIPKGYLGRGIPHAMTRDRLELFAVLCIETSHYVSFVKYGPNNQDWIFFDSMADREGESDGFNIPEVRACPEVGTYLEMSPAELVSQVPRDMKGVAKRLFCDAYMYLYQSTSMSLYR
ncbi:ubiquitin carboxyl-terminal hydrolase CYLD [Melanotaenia boesemani]|uniref:ubiquitin carboxyl-terminal hydrolase CYLD n=1 Tax=Melanotaenia boesemani TaxID=1250792 RepID=UPI001C03E767|nr:ubiquitin carboxyl-terminal hydrolase CYLD [Melanotaenia boesemani]XP_041862562.1 ubiquitin carboxyl-terminal hydrolase CYLD [Melanotaenia boesemani]XP_041862563.1 ubiquitin carboxyl-terminal hydrolase CYLD [Melanotaenia boesemani]